MTDKLQKLINEWQTEKEMFEIAQKRFMDSVSTLAKLNEMIYKQCKSEGIDIENLNLNQKP